MRVVLGYLNGRAIWSDNQPAEPLGSKRVSGSLVQGAPGSVEMGRIQKRGSNRKSRAAEKAES